MQTTAITFAQVIELLIPLFTFLLFLAGLALAFWRMRRERKGAEKTELDRLETAQNTLEALLRQALYGLVTTAEHTQGAGTGPLKKSMVLTELLRLLPENMLAAFSAETLSEWIETALEQARPLWNGGENTPAASGEQ